ncbi:MAG: hypothetical protein WC058_09145 [Phycisphaeraceae bacterium]
MLEHAQLLSETEDIQATLSAESGREPLPRTVRRYPLGAFDIEVEDCPPGWEEPAWWLHVLGRIRVFEGLKTNWDSYGAPAIAVRAMGETIKFLCDWLPPDAPAPDIVPLPDGNIQVEWHMEGFDLEIKISEHGPCGVFLYEHHSGEELDVPIRGDMTAIASGLHHFSWYR